MLSPFDDYPLHQVARPLAQPATSDRNAYDRYWFGACHRHGAFMVEAAFGRYANLGVVDGSVSIVRDGVQSSFHVSGATPADPADTRIGPMRLEIVEPMRRLRIVVDDNDTGVSAALEWRARIGALLEDHSTMERQGRVIVDMDRFVQFGTWAGTVTVDGITTELHHDEVVGVRDRSWGVRPVGEPEPGRPSTPNSVAWLWAPVHFDDECRTLGYFQHPGGEIWRGDGFRLPVTEPVEQVTSRDAPGVQRLEPVGQRLRFEPGSRWIVGGELVVEPVGADAYTMAVEPMCRFHMRGLGYTNPTWGHGVWHGPLATGREDWRLDEMDPADPYAQHVHHAVTVRIGDRLGTWVLEQILFGPHTQLGFREFLDGAA